MDLGLAVSFGSSPKRGVAYLRDVAVALEETGFAWSWEEFAALGVPWERRGKRTDEYIEAMRAVWNDTPASYDGEFISFGDVVLLPDPVTPGGPKILVGGDSDGAIRRAARLGDGWYGWWVGFELEPKIEKVRQPPRPVAPMRLRSRSGSRSVATRPSTTSPTGSTKPELSV